MAAHRRLRIWTMSAGMLAAAVFASLAAGQMPASSPALRAMGLKLPPGVTPRTGHGERLAYQPAAGQPQVVRLQATVGNYRVVMLPTGELTLVDGARTRPTDAAFRPATEDEMKKAVALAGFSDYQVVSAPPYLFAYKSGEGFFLHARSILESMYPGVLASLRKWKLPVAEPELPLVVVIMPSRAEFDAFQPMPAEVVAYYNVLTNYVVMYEDQELWEAAPELAAKQAAYTIAHEGIHQLLANTGIERRMSRWPMWISEGLPEYYCPLKVHSRLVRKGNAELPARTLKWTDAGMVNDLRMYELLRITSHSGEVTKNLVQARELDGKGYALAWGLVHYLVNEQPDAFEAYLKDISRLGPYEGTDLALAGRIDPHFVKHFGEDFAELERGVQEHLTSKPMQTAYKDPVVNQTHYLVRRVLKQGRTFHIALMVTTSPAAARKWKEEQEQEFKKAKFFTKICKTRREAEYEVAKLQQL